MKEQQLIISPNLIRLTIFWVNRFFQSSWHMSVVALSWRQATISTTLTDCSILISQIKLGLGFYAPQTARRTQIACYVFKYPANSLLTSCEDERKEHTDVNRKPYKTPIKGIVHPNYFGFASSLEQIWRNVAFHHLLTNGSSAVNGCRQNESPNS